MREKCQANVIASDMFVQVGVEGHQFLVLEEVVNHKNDDSAAPTSEGMV